MHLNKIRTENHDWKSRKNLFAIFKFIFVMVFILGSNSKHVAHACRKTVFSEKKNNLRLPSSEWNALNRSMKRLFSLRAHPFLSCHGPASFFVLLLFLDSVRAVDSICFHVSVLHLRHTGTLERTQEHTVHKQR